MKTVMSPGDTGIRHFEPLCPVAVEQQFWEPNQKDAGRQSDTA
jgi:hypothetical protein